MPLAVAFAIIPDGGDGEEPEGDNDVDTAESDKEDGSIGNFIVLAGAFAGLCQVRPAAQRPFTSRSTTRTGRHGFAYVATHTSTNQNKIQMVQFFFPEAHSFQKNEA